MKDIRSRMVSITDRVAAKAADKYRLNLVRKPSTDEWVVKVFVDGKFDEGKSYYTDDKQDAVRTMAQMKREMGITAAFVDQPVPWSKETEADLEKQREEAELKLKRELQEVKGDFWEPGRTLAIHFAMTGIPMFMNYGMNGLRSLAYRDGVLTVNPEWRSTKQEFNSYSWAPLADKMIEIVKQSQRISDMVEDTLKRVEDKLKIEIPRDVRQDIAKWIERAAERRLSVRAYPGPKGKEFVITPQSADASRTAAGVSGNEILKALREFGDVGDALETLIRQYDDYWSFGTSPDAVLEDMMAMSTEIASVARPLLKKLKNKIPAWEKEARSRR